MTFPRPLAPAHSRSSPSRSSSSRAGTSRSDSPATASRGQLLEAARLGAAVATADLACRPADAAPAYASWRRLRRRAGRQARQLLRVAFDTGYGRAMQGSDVMPH